MARPSQIWVDIDELWCNLYCDRDLWLFGLCRRELSLDGRETRRLGFHIWPLQTSHIMSVVVQVVMPNLLRYRVSSLPIIYLSLRHADITTCAKNSLIYPPGPFVSRRSLMKLQLCQNTWTLPPQTFGWLPFVYQSNFKIPPLTHDSPTCSTRMYVVVQ